MRVLVTTESRFECTPDGACWTQGPSGFEFWRRYLDVFDEVAIVARVRKVAVAPNSGVRADGPGVSVLALPYYVGPWQYLRHARRLGRAAAGLLQRGDAVILRAPGMAASLLCAAVNKMRRPYAVEVVGDPQDVFARGGVRSILRPILRRRIPATLRRQCQGACAVAYVTTSNLQDRYPAAPGAFVSTYSSIDLPDEAFASSPREFARIGRPQRVLFIGSLEQMYKAPDVLIKAVGMMVHRGIAIQLTMIGEGRHRSELEAQSATAGLSGVIRWFGALPSGAPIRAALDEADLFVLPSRTEGLPRAMIEAMARGVPCLGTRVGGIPDLLSPGELVPPGDAAALMTKMTELLSDSARLTALSRENISKARSYAREVLRPRRRAFYETVRNMTRRAHLT